MRKEKFTNFIMLLKWKLYVKPLEIIGYWCLYQFRKFTNMFPYDFRGVGEGNVISIETKTIDGSSKASFSGEVPIEVFWRVRNDYKEYMNI